MRILFICPTQKPGACGVGDYTRRLAAACGKKGAECGIVSINESDPVGNDARPVTGFASWRIDKEDSGQAKFNRLKRIGELFNPEWISLQFVPYGYHPKGLPVGLGKMLDALPRIAKKHLFFHELSLGLHIEESAKNRVYGFLQRRVIRKLLRAWAPDVIHTHAAPYLAWLRREGIEADELPLFGNVQPASGDCVREAVHPLFDAWLQRREVDPNILLGGYFGTFYEGAGSSDFIAKHRACAVKANKMVALFLAGRQNPAARQRWEAIAGFADERINFVFLGQLSDPAVSSYLLHLDFGVAATPFALVGKSGSVAVMNEHGLPIFVPRNDWTPRFPVKPTEYPLVVPAWRDLSLDCILKQSAGVRSPRDTVSTVADAFLKSLAVF